MEELIKNLYPINACLLGEGYDTRLEYLKHLIDLEVLEIPSGTTFGTWTVPDEWIVRDAWVKYKGRKIIDYKKEPLSLVVGSLPFKGTVDLEELKKHLHFAEDTPDATPYVFKYYDKDWGFSVPKSKVLKKKNEEWVDKLKEGEYEVLIDTEYKPGVMKIGVHTIPGKRREEILLFAHLDHPFQANDNLSGVACLLDTIKKLKTDYTVKLVFCPETIGSHIYAHLADLSAVEFVIAVDICGNDNNLMVQKPWDDCRFERVVHCALQERGEMYRKGKFRTSIGSDEGVFSDPLIGIPSILVSRHPYKEYHTNEDTPDKIDYEKISETADFIARIIEIYEKDFIPERKFRGFLMRSKYNIQSALSQVNLNYDYLFYSIDGEHSVAELAANFEMSFEHIYKLLTDIEKDGYIRRIDVGEVGQY